MRRITNGIVGLIVVGFFVALLRQFDWDPFAAAEWALSWVWDSITRVADIWSNNETFQEVTKKPNDG